MIPSGFELLIFDSISSFIEAHVQKKLDVDAILLATPWNVTETVILDVLSLAKPVLAEKPLTLSLARLEEIEKRGYAKNLLCCYNRCYFPFMPRLKQLVSHSDAIMVVISDPAQS